VVLNPLRSEQEAFRFLIYVAIAVAVVVGVVLLLRAIL
jgi:predicted nucleic acid-binding Zn ribbon protein